jgi:predicted Zn-dependent protease
MSEGAPAIVRQRRNWGRRVLTGLTVLAAAAALCVTAIAIRSPTELPYPPCVTERDLKFARESFALKYKQPADRNDLSSWLAEWYLSKNRLSDAVDCFAVVPTSHQLYGHMARYQQARTLLTLHRVAEAEQQFRELIAAEESSPSIERQYLIDARQRLRHILEVELRFEERHQMLQHVIDRNEDDAFEAVAGCFPSMLRWNGPDAIQWNADFLKADPGNVWVRISYGRYLTSQGKAQEALSQLQGVVRDAPDNLWARAALIICLTELGDIDAADLAIEALPPLAETDPWPLLIQRSRYDFRHNNPTSAARALTILKNQDRTSTEAWQGLAQSARLLNDDSMKHAIEMVSALGRIQNYLGKTTQDATNPNSFLDVADLCAEFQLIREGAIMTRVAMRMAPQDPRVQSSVQSYRKRLADDGLPPLLGN